MPRTSSRFTQADVTKLLKAAKGAGYGCVSIEVLPGNGGLRATYKLDLAGSGNVQQYRLGPADDSSFRTMTVGETATLQKYRSLPSRERLALDVLSERHGRDVSTGEIKRARDITQLALEAKGYAILKRERGKIISWTISPDGEAFSRQVKALPAHL